MFFLLMILALLQPSSSAAQTPSVSVLAHVNRSHGGALFPLHALAPFGARIESGSHGVRLQLYGQTLSFDYGSPFFKAGKEIYQLVAPARSPDLVSIQLVTEFLPKLFPNKLVFESGVLRIRSEQAAVLPARAQAVKPEAKTERIVIVDAGHGGRDPGKIGPNGLAEKNVTLTVAHKLAALLRGSGYEVHMTRTTDTLISLADRPKLANQWKNGRPPTVFVSIHANAGVAQAAGYETYFLSEARTEDERRVAEMENAAVAYEDKKPSGPAIEQLLTGLRNDYYQRASNDFAEVVQRELGAFHPGNNRGVKQAGFRVLVGALMPAVLVEIAFISHPNEARLLGSSSFQDKIAYSLARSIGNFFESHSHLWTSQ